MPLPARLGVPKRRLEGLEGLRPGKRQAWTPRKSYWWGLGLGVPKGIWSVCRVACLAKRQAWTPRKSYWCGLGVFACGVGGAKKAPWQTAHLNANKKLLVGPWCLCLQGWGCQKRVWQTAGLNVKKKLLMGLGAFACGVGGAKKAFGALGEFEASQTAGLNAKKKLLMWPWCLCLQAWGCQKGVWSVWRVWGLANGRRERQ